MLPWADMLRTGLSLGLSPAGFWSLSAREWLWLTRPQSSEHMRKTRLQALMEEHPDGSS